MRTRLFRSVASGVVCLLLAGVNVAEAVPAAGDEAKLRDAYQQRLQELKQESSTAKADLLARYRKILGTLRDAARQKGDLDAVQAADAEIQRFEKLKTLPPITPPAAAADLDKAARSCRDAIDKKEVEGARKVIDLTDRYMATMEMRKKEAVRSDKLDLAKAYDTEQKAAREAPAFQEAKFLLAEKATPLAEPRNEAHTEPSAPAPDAGKAPVAVTPVAPPPMPQPAAEPEELYDAQRMVVENHALGGPSGTSAYKPFICAETGKAPMTGNVKIALEGYLDNENTRYQLRVKLRAKTMETNLVNLKVLVQYFVKVPGGSAQELRTQFMRLPALGQKYLLCDMKPISEHSVMNAPSRSRVGAFSEFRELQLAGVVVNVFSKEDKLIAQVGSSNELRERGKTTFEMPPPPPAPPVFPGMAQ